MWRRSVSRGGEAPVPDAMRVRFPARSTMRLPTLFALCCAVSGAALGAPIHIQKFDLNHSTIAFRVPILGGMSEVEGKFMDFAVDLAYDEASPAGSGVVATIQAAS